MKNFSVEILLMYIIFASAIGSISCFDSEVINNRSARRPSPENFLLEVSTELKGMVYPTGKVLNIKLYTSGRAEYDYYPPRSAEKALSLERKEIFLDPKDLEKVKALVADLNSLSAESQYLPVSPRMDAAITSTVIYRIDKKETRIILNENDSDLLLEKKQKIYPKPLLDLLRFVQQFHRNLLQSEQI